LSCLLRRKKKRNNIGIRKRGTREILSALEEKEADDEVFGACMFSPPSPSWHLRKGDQSSYAISIQPYDDSNEDNYETGVSREKRTPGELLKQLKLRKKVTKEGEVASEE